MAAKFTAVRQIAADADGAQDRVDKVVSLREARKVRGAANQG